MNKAILKHEIRSMKWVLLLSTLASLFLVVLFSLDLEREFLYYFSDGLSGNRMVILNSFRNINSQILIIFSLISIVQLFMQFKSEKGQETARFLKSLPVERKEFFKVKLIVGLVNISIAFIVLALGLLVVRNNNMFWIKDIHDISVLSKPFINLDGIGNLLKEIGLIYLVIVSFYTFLLMVQYNFTNLVGAIVTGILVWFSPAFILASSISTIDRIFPISLYNSHLLNRVNSFYDWLLPHIYPLDYSYFGHNIYGANISIVENLGIKYLIVAGLILANIILAYKFNERSKIEDENKVIVFKTSRNIFKFGVTICSALLVSVVLNEILGLTINNFINLVLILLGALVGYLISRKITQVESI